MAEPVAEPAPLARAFATDANVLLPGLYAWATTVALPAASAQATLPVRLAALSALLCLAPGALLWSRFPKLGHALGIHAFVGCCIVAWALLRRDGVPLGVQGLEAAFGAVGWVLYAFGWGELSARRRVPERDPHVIAGAPLAPRNPWSRSAEAILALGIAGSFVLLFLSFRVARAPHSVMAHGVWVLLTVLLVSSAARVALGRGPRRMGGDRERLNAAAAALAALFVALALGVMYSMLER